MHATPEGVQKWASREARSSHSLPSAGAWRGEGADDDSLWFRGRGDDMNEMGRGGAQSTSYCSTRGRALQAPPAPSPSGSHPSAAAEPCPPFPRSSPQSELQQPHPSPLQQLLQLQASSLLPLPCSPLPSSHAPARAPPCPCCTDPKPLPARRYATHHPLHGGCLPHRQSPPSHPSLPSPSSAVCLWPWTSHDAALFLPRTLFWTGVSSLSLSHSHCLPHRAHPPRPR